MPKRTTSIRLLVELCILGIGAFIASPAFAGAAAAPKNPDQAATLTLTHADIWIACKPSGRRK